VVFLVAENCLLRESLVRVLRKRDDLLVAGAIAYSGSALEEVFAAKPDVVLFDSAKIALSGHRAVSRLREAGQHAKIALIGMEEDEGTFLRAVAEGVLGYVLEDATAAEHVRAIRAVASGEAVCPPRYSSLLFQCAARDLSFSGNPAHRSRFGLSRREQQLLGLVRQGLANKEIATFLNLSEQTVKNHIHRMLRKVGATDRLDLVKRCQSEQQALSASRPVAESEPPPAREVPTHSLIATLVPKRSRIERRQRGQMLSLPQAGSSSTGRCAKKVAAGSSVNA
jgi:DNA-binding NarL/FixJ family response regulator